MAFLAALAVLALAIVALQPSRADGSDAQWNSGVFLLLLFSHLFVLLAFATPLLRAAWARLTPGPAAEA